MPYLSADHTSEPNVSFPKPEEAALCLPHVLQLLVCRAGRPLPWQELPVLEVEEHHQHQTRQVIGLRGNMWGGRAGL